MSLFYNKTIWKDLPSKDSPINATNLNKIENGISDCVDGVNHLQTYSATKAELTTKLAPFIKGLDVQGYNLIQTKGNGDTIVTPLPQSGGSSSIPTGTLTKTSGGAIHGDYINFQCADLDTSLVTNVVIEVTDETTLNYLNTALLFMYLNGEEVDEVAFERVDLPAVGTYEALFIPKSVTGYDWHILKFLYSGEGRGTTLLSNSRYVNAGDNIYFEKNSADFNEFIQSALCNINKIKIEYREGWNNQRAHAVEFPWPTNNGDSNKGIFKFVMTYSNATAVVELDLTILGNPPTSVYSYALLQCRMTNIVGTMQQNSLVIDKITVYS